MLGNGAIKGKKVLPTMTCNFWVRDVDRGGGKEAVRNRVTKRSWGENRVIEFSYKTDATRKI